MASASTRPRRTPRVHYHDDDSESGDYNFTSVFTPRPTRDVSRVQTYRESSDDDSSVPPADEADSILDTEASPAARESHPSQGQNIAPPKKSKVYHATRSKVSKSSRPSKRQKTQTAGSATESIAQPAVTVWTTSTNTDDLRFQALPLHILLSIMRSAAYPLYGPQSRERSVTWLFQMRLLSSSLHDACLGALLHSPPLYPLKRGLGLINLLQKERAKPNSLSIVYGPRIRYLEIEVKHLLSPKGGIPVDELVSLTPQLQGIRLYSNYDDLTTVLWAQPEAKKVRWSYGSGALDLMMRLQSENINLRSFEWNGRFPSATEVLKEARAAHFRPPFRHIRELTFLNLTQPEKAHKIDVISAQKFLRSLLAHVPDLRSLSFRSCAMIDEITMSMLPSGLLDLEITNCPRLTSDLLGNYLASAGSTLRSIKLLNNQSMSLGFTSKLKTLCPRLDHLEIDMVYIDPSSWHDTEPLFDELLPDGPPTWPTSLVEISIENMRQVTEPSAEKFFESLVNASQDLPDLRKLNLKVILKDAGWRERAKLRQKWIPAIQELFLNTDEPANMITELPAKAPSSSNRHSSRIAQIKDKTEKSDGNDENNDEDNDIDTKGEDGTAAPKPIHARCDVVELVISDQRPAETQFHENDFLDSEPEDDDEYKA